LVSVQPTLLLIVELVAELLLMFTVGVPVNVTFVPTADQVVPEPKQVILDEPKANTIPLAFTAVIVKVEQTAPLIVTMPVPDAESKVTASVEIGALAPPAPPEERDQLAVEAVSHVPVPPTQYLLAI